MSFQAQYILKGKDNEVLGHISFSTKIERWFFMPTNPPLALFTEDLNLITEKLTELETEPEKPSLLDTFKENREV